MINRASFFEKIRESLFSGSLSQLQVDTIEAILNECELQEINDLRQVAYCLATSYHECHNPHHPELRLTPMKEYGGETYLKSKPYYPFFARGLSGLTWKQNYIREGLRLKLDLVNNPDLILDTNIAANSHIYCMKHGSYTGKKLDDFINAVKCNFVSARKIINGIDKAYMISDYAKQFLIALTI